MALGAFFRSRKIVDFWKIQNKYKYCLFSQNLPVPKGVLRPYLLDLISA